MKKMVMVMVMVMVVVSVGVFFSASYAQMDLSTAVATLKSDSNIALGAGSFGNPVSVAVTVKGSEVTCGGKATTKSFSYRLKWEVSDIKYDEAGRYMFGPVFVGGDYFGYASL